MPASRRNVRLVKWVVASTPIGQDQAKANSLEDAGQSPNGDSVKWALLREYLRDELG